MGITFAHGISPYYGYSHKYHITILAQKGRLRKCNFWAKGKREMDTNYANFVII
jgi:hypothetical protein